MWIIDFETKRFLEVNETAIQKYGYSREEFMNMTVHDLRTQSEAEKLQLEWKWTRNVDVYFGQWQHVTQSGNVIDVEIISHKITYNQQPASLILINDITERIQTRKLLEQSNQRFEYVSEVSFNAIWDWDLVSGNMYWGNGYTELFGYALDDNKGSISQWENRIHKKDAKRVTENLKKAIADGANFWQESYDYLKADGTWAYVLDRGKILKDENGKPYRKVGAMQDETFNKYNQSMQEIENIIYTLNLQQQVSFKDVIDVLLIELVKLHPNMLASVLT
jgi:PAS domain S-box-containing protein